MIICILALLVFIGLVVTKFLKINKKLYIMAALIIALLLLHIVD